MIEVDDATVGYDGEAVLADVDLVVERGHKLAVVGPNGAGKSTLLRMLVGELEPMRGTSALGSNVDIAHFAQHQVDVLPARPDRHAGVHQRRRPAAEDPQPADGARVVRVLRRGRRPAGRRPLRR